MAKERTTSRFSSTGQFLTVRKSTNARARKVKFGSVTISGNRPSPAEVEFNIERSTEALARATHRLTRPGVSLRAKKDVPHFAVAEGEAGVFIRQLNGRIDRGRLVDGTFQVID